MGSKFWCQNTYGKVISVESQLPAIMFTFTFLVFTFFVSTLIFFQATCNALVESQLPAIIDGLVNDNLNPQEICTQIAACPWLNFNLIKEPFNKAFAQSYS